MWKKTILFALLLAATAVAATSDPRGWSEGQIAANAPRWFVPLADGPHLVAYPASFAQKFKRPTLVVYFSPTCPHCQAVAPELVELSKRLGKRADVVGVASGSSTPEQIAEFNRLYGVRFEVVHDVDSEIAQAMGARSTPSALLVEKKADGVHVLDAWYPYVRGHDALVELRVAKEPWSAFRKGEYQGNATCGACHVQEMDSWALSHHAVAWNTLVKREKQADAACNTCHVTGAGQPTGWDGDEHSPLVDVGCEACHGPGGPHDGERSEPRDACGACHDEKHSIAFSYEKGLPLLDHFEATAMSDVEFQGARAALWEGNAPRELLAFGDGAFVGAEVCSACHAEQHAQWQASPHSRAMARLTEGKETDVSCVRCHASPKRSGLPPAELSGFHLGEGVSCESCHGPGEAHAAAGGGTDNIVGLGESCPVCVIEAVCTSCHTSAWDPDWNLDADLPKVGHAAR